MKCIDVKENLGALIDGEVGISPVGEIETHLASCISCRTERENLRTVSRSIRQTSPMSAPAMLDRKVILAFQAFRDAKHRKNTAKEKPIVAWFGIPRFAFAAALAFFFLTAVSAYQIGKISARENAVAARQGQDDRSLPATDPANDPVKTVEVPVIQEKIIRVPIITEKIITKTILVEKKQEKTGSTKNMVALKSSAENNGYLTTTDLKGFRPVSELKVTISKKENRNEK